MVDNKVSGGLGMALAIAAALLASADAGAVVLSIGGTSDATLGMVTSHTGINASYGFDLGNCAATPATDLGNGGSYRQDDAVITNVRRNPTGDSSCFGSVGFGSVQAGFPNLKNLSYFGFYWGSVDDYNQFQLVRSNGSPLTITYSDGTNTFSNTVLSGADLRSLFGLSDTGGIAPSVFVNFAFADTESVATFRFGSIINTAFEFDNLAGINRSLPLGPVAHPALGRASVAVPEPAMLSLLGGAALLLAARRRRAR